MIRPFDLHEIAGAGRIRKASLESGAQWTGAACHVVTVAVRTVPNDTVGRAAEQHKQQPIITSLLSLCNHLQS